MSHLFHPYTPFSAIQAGNFPHIVRGEGIYLFDDQGNRYVDVVSSWWACSLGHNHPKIVQAIQQQAGILQHSITGGMTHPTVIELAETLSHLMPTPDRHVVFASDGASAVEAALKIAVQYWYNIGRPEKKALIGMDQGYHGDSLGALGVGFVDHFHEPYSEIITHTAKLPFPQPTPTDPNGFEPSRTIITAHANHLAAIILEPLCLGSAGMKMYPADYLKQLAECCKENEVLLIVDEIAMGFGRTGERFAHNHAGIDPDLVCIGKALTGGYMPLSACIIKDRLYDTFSNLGCRDGTFYHGNTYAGHPIGCAAALAALRIYEAENTVANTTEKAATMRDQMKPLEQRSCVKETRFLGMIGVVELHSQYADKMPHIKYALRQAGYLFRPLGTIIYLMPPLIISIDDLTKAINALADALPSE
ncbi:MAG: adenosylmethionine--8-amino-7-oxononanoate transaminase [Pontiellaceae bacterium]|nr:adenosylmethionine--8-amino-7-oxononanoate transaminase [Verrucomicrobiota bacterium]